MTTFDPQMLRPIVALVAWTLVMLGWMLATRLPAMRAAGIRIASLTGSKPSDGDRSLPPSAQWKAHNYNHLTEQPVLFYAICLTHALLGPAGAVMPALAWTYVGLRVAHSFVQATRNRVLPRFILFMASTAALLALTLGAAVRLW